MNCRTLLELTTHRSDFDPGLTIYAAEPWSPSSLAIVAAESVDGSIPPIALHNQCRYFLEVFIVNEVLSGWSGSDLDACHRLIKYAESDA
ncbi:MAG: hypothetical protein QM811_29720 [Pirellulales bacterium]